MTALKCYLEFEKVVVIYHSPQNSFVSYVCKPTAHDENGLLYKLLDSRPVLTNSHAHRIQGDISKYAIKGQRVY